MHILARSRRILHGYVVGFQRAWYRRVWGMHIGEGVRISLSCKLDKTNPKGITIGDYTAVTFGVAILSHDYVNRRHLATKIGSHCFIGCNSIIMPGVTIGDHCIVGAGSVVMRDVPSHSVVTGNPGRVLERDIETLAYGVRISAAIPSELAAHEAAKAARAVPASDQGPASGQGPLPEQGPVSEQKESA
nr:acyltransferase [Sandaracinobacteroides hominis]